MDGTAEGRDRTERAALTEALDLLEASSLGSPTVPGPSGDDVLDETVARAVDRLAGREIDRAATAAAAFAGATDGRAQPAGLAWTAAITRLTLDAALEPDAVVADVVDRIDEAPPAEPEAWGTWSLSAGSRAAAALVAVLGGRWFTGGYAELHRSAMRESRGTPTTSPAPVGDQVSGVPGVLAPDPRLGATRVAHLSMHLPMVLARRAVLSELVRDVSGPRPTSTVLLGPPGHGKTVVASAVVDRMRLAEYPAVFVIPAADLRGLVVGLERVLLRLRTPAQTLAAARRHDRAEHASALWALLDVPDRRWLLVLDDAGPDAVGHPAWTRPPRYGHVIVTSTAGTVAAWTPSRAVTMRALAAADGARLVLDRLRTGSERVDAEDERLARDLSSMLAGSPLALSRLSELVARSGTSLAGWTAAVGARRGDDAVALVVAIALDTLGSARDAARDLLGLLSCYAPGEPLPVAVLDERAREALVAVERTGLLERFSGVGKDTVNIHGAISSRLRLGATHEELVRWERRAVGLLRERLDTLDPGVPQAGPVVVALEPHVVHLVQDCHAVDPTELLLLADAAATGLIRCGQQESATSLLALARSRAPGDGVAAAVSLALRLTDAWVVAVAHGGDLRRALDLLVELARESERLLGDEHPVSLAVLDTLAWARAERDDLDGAEALFTRVLAARTRTDGPDGLTTLGTRHRLAWVWAMQGRVQEATDEFGVVLGARIAALGTDHYDVYSTTYRWHWAQSRVGRHDEAIAGFDELFTRVEAVVGPDHQLALLVRSRSAWARMWSGDAVGALKLYAPLVADQEKVLGPTHRRVLINRHNAAALHLWLGRAVEGEAELAEVIGARRELLGPDHPATLDSRELHAWAVLRLGRVEDAERMLTAVLADRHRTLGPAHESTLATRYRLLRAMLSLGRVAEAERQARELLDDLAHPDPSRPAYPSVPVVRGPLPAGSQPGVLEASVRHALAVCRAQRGHPEEACAMLEDVLARRTAVIGEDAPEALLIRDRLGWATALTDPVGGAAILADVRDRRVAVLGTDHPHTLTSESRVAWAWTQAGELTAALRAYERLEPRVAALVGECDPQTLRVRAGRAQALRRLGRAAEALVLARDLHHAQLEVQGSRAVDTLRAAEEVGLALAALGFHAEALAQLRDVLAERRLVLGEDHRDTVRVRRAVEDLLAG